MADCYDDDGEKLVLAAGRGDVTDVRRFVRGSTLSYEDGWGRTALVSASYLGNVEVPVSPVPAHTISGILESSPSHVNHCSPPCVLLTSTQRWDSIIPVTLHPKRLERVSVQSMHNSLE